MNHQMIATCIGLGLFAAVASVQATDLEAGKKLASATCASCHGPEGRTPAAPNYPILAGQYRDYLLRSLRAYKSGDRENAVMNGMVSALSDRDLQNLAAWYANQEGLETLKVD